MRHSSYLTQFNKEETLNKIAKLIDNHKVKDNAWCH